MSFSKYFDPSSALDSLHQISTDEEDGKDVEETAPDDSKHSESDKCDKKSADCTSETSVPVESESKEEESEDEMSTDDQDEFETLPQMDATSLSVRAGSIFDVTVFGNDKKSVDAIKPFENPDIRVLGEEHGSHIGDDGKTVYTTKFSFRIQTAGRYEVMKCAYDYLHVTVVPGPVFVPRSLWKPEEDEKLAVIGHVCAVGNSVRYIFHPCDEFGNPTTIDEDFVRSLSIRAPEGQDIKLDVECVGDSGVRLSFIPKQECFVHCTVLFDGKEWALFPSVTIVALRQSVIQSLESSWLAVPKIPCRYRSYERDGYPYVLDVRPLNITVEKKSVVVREAVFTCWWNGLAFPFASFDINQSLEIKTSKPNKSLNVHLILKQCSPIVMELDVKMNWYDALQVIASIKLSQFKQARCGSMEKRVSMLRNNLLSMIDTNSPQDMVIKRDRIIHDALRLFSAHNQKTLLRQTSITFKGEEAVDAGGPSKEFFTTLHTLLFGSDGGLWTTPDIAIRYPSPIPTKRPRISSGSTTEEVRKGSLVPFAFTPEPFCSDSVVGISFKSLYELCGVLAARAVVDYVLGRNMPQIPFPIASSVFKFILDQPVDETDLKNDDPDYWRGKVQCIKNNSMVDVGVTFTEDLFTMDNKLVGRVCIDPEDPRSYYGFCKTAKQIIDCALNTEQESREVSDETKELYLRELAKYRLQGAMREHLTWFKEGFVRVLGKENVGMFSAHEYMMMCCGSTGRIDVQDLRAHALFPFDSPVVGWLWQALDIFCESEKRKFLLFVTGRLSPPRGGFKDLRPSFTIRVTDDPVTQLPVSHTCFNVLELPAYGSSQELFAKLLIAINDGNGFFGIE